MLQEQLCVAPRHQARACCDAGCDMKHCAWVEASNASLGVPCLVQGCAASGVPHQYNFSRMLQKHGADLHVASRSRSASNSMTSMRHRCEAFLAGALSRRLQELGSIECRCCVCFWKACTTTHRSQSTSAPMKGAGASRAHS